MILIKRKKFYHARFKSQEGKIVSVSTKESDYGRAMARVKEAKLDQLEAAGRTHRLTQEGIIHIVAGKRITIARALEEWERGRTDARFDPRSITCSLSTVRKWAFDMDLLNLSPIAVIPKHVNNWINNPRSTNKQSTRRIALSHISQFLTFCTYSGWNMGNQAKLVRVNLDLLTHQQRETTQRECFTCGEISQIIALLEARAAKLNRQREGFAPCPHRNMLNAKLNRVDFWRFAVRLADETGLRLGDIAQLERACFDTEGTVIVWTDKRDKRVAVPISKDIQTLFTEIPIMDGRFMFPDQRELVRDPKRKAALSVQFIRLCHHAGIEGKSFHCLRHTRITAWRKEFVSEGMSYDQAILKIGKLVGHSNRKTTEGYDH